MPNRSIRDEMQRNRVRPSDPEKVREALYGKSSSAKESVPSTPIVRPDRPTVRGQSRVNINQGAQVRAQMDSTLEKLEKGT